MGPGPQDMGQPTHFLPGRHFGVFSVTVPEAEAERRLTWTVRVNNQPSEIAFTTVPDYFANPFLERATGNTPPLLRVGAGGDELQGPSRGVAATCRGGGADAAGKRDRPTAADRGRVTGTTCRSWSSAFAVECYLEEVPWTG